MGGKQYQTICFTSFESREATEAKLRECGADWWIYGVETTSDGRVHLQGMAYAKTKRSWLNKMRPIHIEPCKDPIKSIQYCRKGKQPHGEWELEGAKGSNYGKDAEVYEHGTQPTFNIRGERERLTNAQIINGNLEELVEQEKMSISAYPRIKMAKQMYQLHAKRPRAPEGPHWWIIGPPGSGKTTAAYQYSTEIYIKSQNKWWDGYDGQEVVLLDDFDKGGTVLSHYLKIWADTVIPVKGEVKGGTVPLFYKNFIVTSNYAIEDLWPGEEEVIAALKRRFKVWKKPTKEHVIDWTLE